MMWELLGVPVAAALDRLRGDAKGPGKTPEALLYGLLIAWMLGYPPFDWLWFAIAGLFALGSGPGWGEPMGAIIDEREMRTSHLEWWQVGPTKDNPWLALTVRGFMWGLPACVLAPWAPEVLALPVAYGIAFPLSMKLAKTTMSWWAAPGTRTWAASEWIRGGIGSALSFISTLL